MPDAFTAVQLPNTCSDGRAVFGSLLQMAEAALAGMPSDTDRHAAIGTIRGTGPGVSLGGLIERLEGAFPIEVVFPFEGSERVGGGVWDADRVLGEAHPGAVVKLYWCANADDLPMHTHEVSDRFIIVLEGRGLFHVSDDPVGDFRPESTRTIAVRERDVLVFTRGVVHTFSTGETPMTLLSVHLPYVPLEGERQYTLPPERWTARERLGAGESRITAGRWSRLA